MLSRVYYMMQKTMFNNINFVYLISMIVYDLSIVLEFGGGSSLLLLFFLSFVN